MSGMASLLDTYVTSELMRAEPSPAVLAWIDGVGVEGLVLSAVSQWKIRYSLALLPEGKRRDDLARRFDGLAPISLVPASTIACRPTRQQPAARLL